MITPSPELSLLSCPVLSPLSLYQHNTPSPVKYSSIPVPAKPLCPVTIQSSLSRTKHVNNSTFLLHDVEQQEPTTPRHPSISIFPLSESNSTHLTAKLLQQQCSPTPPMPTTSTFQSLTSQRLLCHCCSSTVAVLLVHDNEFQVPQWNSTYPSLLYTVSHAQTSFPQSSQYSRHYHVQYTQIHQLNLLTLNMFVKSTLTRTTDTNSTAQANLTQLDLTTTNQNLRQPADATFRAPIWRLLTVISVP